MSEMWLICKILIYQVITFPYRNFHLLRVEYMSLIKIPHTRNFYVQGIIERNENLSKG